MKTILVVDDEQQYCELYALSLREAGFGAETYTIAEEVLSRSESPDMIISDMRMEPMDGLALLKTCREKGWEMPFLFVTAYADIKQAVQALKLGAVDYLEKPVDLEELIVAVCDAVGCKADHQDETRQIWEDAGIVVKNVTMQRIYRDAEQVARSEATVLITGESGTGKDILANFIHQQSQRREKPFLAVNCAAIPRDLLGSELFGHEKGAFTGASSARKGRFREAEGGTLFLDEIGDMSPELQASLLRALEQKVITPVGSDKEVPVDIRLIAATNANLEERLNDGRFREDLYYRLNVITFQIPPLRERREDILPLAKHLLRGGEERRRLSSGSERLIAACDWPGNVRELANAMERASILAASDVILPEHLPPSVRQGESVSSSPDAEFSKSLQQTERDAIEKALQSTKGNRTKAAQLLGISRRALLYKIKRFGLA